MKKTAQLNSVQELIDVVKKHDFSLSQSFDIHSIDEMLELEFYLIVERKIPVRKCKNCNKFFVATGRIDTLYCNRIIDREGKTCRDIGAMNTYRERIKKDPIIKAYNKAYKRYNARVRYNKITKDEFFKWSEEARKLREKVKKGEITLDEFKTWLNE